MLEGKDKIESFLKQIETASFNVKFNSNDVNWNTVKRFKQYCKDNTEDGYLLGINNWYNQRCKGLFEIHLKSHFGII